MKKIFYFLLTISFLLTTNSCNDELDRLWNNPNIYAPEPEEVVSGLFTHMQKTRFWQRDYGEWYWLNDFGSFLELSQLSSMQPYSAAYIDRWADDEYGDVDRYVSACNGNTYGRFGWFYTNLTNYVLIRDEVASLEATEYDNSVIYFRLATILKDVIALQTVDLFNSIPYFDAFKGSEGIFFVPYDDPMEIYKSVIEEYKSIATELPGVYGKMSDLAKTTFATQDLFFKGDINKWVQYINAETLKASVRISGVAEDFVKPYLAEAVKNLPGEDFTFACPYLNACRIGTSGNGGIIQRGLWENYYMMAIPDVLMTRMNRGDDSYDINTDDPRLPVIAMGFTPDGTTDRVEYYGISGDWERNRYLRITLPSGGGRKWNVTPQDNPAYNVLYPSYSMDVMVKACPWTLYNPITYILSETPLYINSVAENDLFLAEVALKGLASTGKTASAHINDAVKHSVDFWYMMNHVPNYAGDMSSATAAIVTPPKPDASIINRYANTVQSEFDAASGAEDKLEILMQQKYIHMNYWGAYECFAELRRTRHPKLEPITCVGSSRTLTNQTMMLERYILPPSERTTNYDEYIKVAPDDHWDKPIFWVPQNKITETYFLPKAIKNPLP
ncbi:MAG: SusD/RagB family nutrient-binding outer membrane lipoprotein [Dysgonamonadaceae bacterium]|jgi:hypothetical protein|nr:SusD/RagB family nutrient-binding outer membrane lipoprotein [Dysgonamonadaceae bacterium]